MMNGWRTMKNGHEIDHGNIMEALWKRLGLDFSSSFSFSSLISVKTSYKWCWTHSLQPLTPIYRKIRGGGCMTARPGELLASPLSFLMGPGGPKGWKMSPKWPFCSSFEHFSHFLPKHHNTLQIARRLVLSSSIRSAKIQILTNDRPQTKLGYDTLVVALKGLLSQNSGSIYKTVENLFLLI